MPKQGKTPKKKSKEKTPQKSEESEYPAMDQDEYNRLLQNAVEYAQAKLEQKHEEHIKALEADREAKIMSTFSNPSEPTLPRNCRRHYANSTMARDNFREPRE